MSFIQFVPAEGKRKPASQLARLDPARFGPKSEKIDSIHNVRELRERVQQIRSGWFSGESKRQNQDYNPSEHDKIKFNINLYLGQCMQFFVDEPADATALVLDSEDLGSSATLRAFGLQPSHIYVPNYWKKSTEYVLMKERLPELACVPISLEDFIGAVGASNDTPSFRTELTTKIAATKYTEPPRQAGELPERFDALDFAYLDYCNKFMNSTGVNNSETVASMFVQELFPRERPFIFAVTGSLHAVNLEQLNDELDEYKTFIIDTATANGYKIRADQFFVYNRSHQEGDVDEALAHKAENFDVVPEDVHLHKQSHSSKMFFMSFIGNYTDEKINAWDALFDNTCVGGQCKLQFGHRECLYQRGQDRLHLSKPFCNYRITDLYFWDPGFNDYSALLQKFAAVPRFEGEDEDDEDFLTLCNPRRLGLPKGIVKTFKATQNIVIDVVDMTKIIDITRQARVGRNSITYWGRRLMLDSIHSIQTEVVRGKVSIECILGNILGIHFTESEHLHIRGIVNLKSACFLVHADDFIKMLDDSVTSAGDDSSDDESQSSAEPSAIPWDLNYVGRIRLQKLTLPQLHDECRRRGIEIAEDAQTCIEKLLAWKRDSSDDDSSDDDAGRGGESKTTSSAEPSVIPWDLNYVGDERLGKLTLTQLRDECRKRGINITRGVHQITCIKKLLAWKRDKYLLKHVGDERLRKLTLPQLRYECRRRRIKITEGAHKRTCIEKLLDWKKTHGQ